MRIHLPGQDITLESAADLSTHQYKFAVPAAGVAGGQQARVNVAGAGARMLGVLQNKQNAAGLGAVVRISGRSKVVVDGSGVAIAVGTPLKSGALGVGLAAVADKDHVGGIALEASTANGDIIDVAIFNYDLAV
jgi:hypothetical protein